MKQVGHNRTNSLAMKSKGPIKAAVRVPGCRNWILVKTDTLYQALRVPDVLGLNAAQTSREAVPCWRMNGDFESLNSFHGSAP
jgi:hypothetical protein